MANQQAKELREKSSLERQEALQELNEKLQNFRLLPVEQQRDSSQLRKWRRQRARILTIIKQQQAKTPATT